MSPFFYGERRGFLRQGAGVNGDPLDLSLLRFARGRNYFSPPVIPAHSGIHCSAGDLDSGLRRNDGYMGSRDGTLFPEFNHNTHTE